MATAASLARPVGLTPVCEELGIPWSTVYAQRARQLLTESPGQRGTHPLIPDLVAASSSQARW